jgi:hypothetical protein
MKAPRIVHDAQQRLLLGNLGRQPHSQTHNEPIGRRTHIQPERRAQRGPRRVPADGRSC